MKKMCAFNGRTDNSFNNYVCISNNCRSVVNDAITNHDKTP